MNKFLNLVLFAALMAMTAAQDFDFGDIDLSGFEDMENWETVDYDYDFTYDGSGAAAAGAGIVTILLLWILLPFIICICICVCICACSKTCCFAPKAGAPVVVMGGGAQQPQMMAPK